MKPKKKSRSLRLEPPACTLSFKHLITNSTPCPSKKEERFDAEKEMQELNTMQEFSSISISPSELGCLFRKRAIDCRSDSIPFTPFPVLLVPLIFEDSIFGRFDQSGRAV